MFDRRPRHRDTSTLGPANRRGRSPFALPGYRKAPDKPDSFALLQQNLDRIKGGKLRIQIFCGTLDKNHLPSLREFHQTLVTDGVDHTYMEIESLAHDLPKMIEQYRPIWYDYHVESLRRSGALPAR